jgi:hypothetical protein
MTAEKMFPSGGWLVSEVIDGGLVTRRYFGYTKREAMRNFKDEAKKEKSK